MKVRLFVCVSVLMTTGFLFASAPTYKLAKLEKAPAGLSKKVTAALDPAGLQVVGSKGPVCAVWFVKDIVVKPGFSAGFDVKYPFSRGQLIGVLQVAKNAKFTDFRGQEMSPGVYTLRYELQPEDGNHIGTSDTRDFLLAVAAKGDGDTKNVTNLEKLAEDSGKAAGSTHPAIFILLPAEAVKTQLTHDEDHDFWIVNSTATGKSKDKTVKVPIRLVAIGHSEE